jgi:hypothetical protein
MYMYCATFFKYLLAIFILWFCPAFWWCNSNICIVFSVFTSRPSSLMASIKVITSFAPWTRSMVTYRKTAAGKYIVFCFQWHLFPLIFIWEIHKIRFKNVSHVIGVQCLSHSKLTPKPKTEEMSKNVWQRSPIKSIMCYCSTKDGTSLYWHVAFGIILVPEKKKYCHLFISCCMLRIGVHFINYQAGWLI